MEKEEVSKLWSIYKKFKPHLLMFSAQLGYTVLYFITEASFNHGMNPHVYVTYRHILGGILILPFAYFLERKQRPKLTVALLLEIFILSLFGVGLTLNTYFASLKYTSPTFVASMVNTIASLTFVIAVTIRLEDLDLRNPRGIAKVAGTLVSLAGVMMMTLYKGQIMRSLGHPLIHIPGKTSIHKDSWLKGSILTVSSCITWSIFYIMQALTLKRYPAQLSLTAWMSFVGGAQSAVFTVITQHKREAWIIGFNIDLWSTIYGGVVCSSIIIFIQLWCTVEKGPVFVTVFNPISTILVAILAYFIFGEKLSTGSVIGAIIVIVGLYLLLWGKEGDAKVHIKPDLPCDGDGVCMLCKTKPPVEETLMCKTCDTPWHATCLSSPLETSLSNLEWECPDCSSLAGDDDRPVKSAGAVVSHALVAAIRAIESDGTLTEREKARKRQELLSGKAKSDEEEKKKKEADSKGTDVLDVLGDSFNCSFCLQLPERPVTTPCGHNFCLKCFERWIKQGKRTCVKCRSNIPSKMASQPRINSALVVAIRMAKMSKLNITEGPVKVYHFVHNENRPDKAFTTERAQKSGKANAASGKIFVTTPPDHFGPIPAANDPIRNQGVLVGECWEDRLECRQWGVHLPHVSGIAGQSKHGAQSVTLSGGYIDDEDHGEWFLYTGSGGRDLSGNKRTNKDQSFDQKFESYNRSLLVSCMKGYPVRVVRSHKEKRSSYAPEKGLRYDGVYRIEKCWRKVGVQGFRVCRYLFVRCDNEPAPWTSDEHGDRPRPLPAIPELKKATDLSERKESPSWDFDEEDGCWKWKKPPPPSKKSVARMDDASQKSSRKAARKAQNMSVRERLLKEFSCLICREVMTLPVTTPCAHNFCKSCLEGAFAGKSFVRERSRGGRALRSQKIVMNCPSCPTDISDFLHNPQVNRELTDVIESLKSKAAEEKADEEKASEENEDLSKESSQEEDEEDDNDDLEEEIKDEESIDISKSNETTEEMSKETGIDDVVKIPETKSKPMKTNKRKKVDAGDCPVENGGDGMKTVGKNSDGSNADSEVSEVPRESTRGANKKAAPAAKRMKKATGGGQGGVGVKTRRGRKAQVTSDGDDSPSSPLLVHSDDNDFE